MSVARSRREQATLDLIQQALREGRVPSAEEIMTALAQLDAADPFDELDREPVVFPEGNRISSKRLNKTIDIIQDELSGAIGALNDAWNTLSSALLDSETLISQTQEAKNVAGEARRMLALTEYADAYRISKALSLGSVADFDIDNSDDVFIDVNAKTMRLAATDILFKPVDALFGGAFRTTPLNTIAYTEVGDANSIVKVGYANRHVVLVPSTDDTDDISVMYELSLTSLSGNDRYKSAEDISVVEVDTQSTYDMHALVEVTYDGYNWEELGQAWGNHKIVVTGPAKKATNVRVTLRKIRSDFVISATGSLRYGYVFDTSQIRVGISSFEKIGHMVSHPISISSSGIASVLVDAKIDKPAGTDVEIYVAEDVNGADPDALNWKRVEPNSRIDLAVRSPYSRMITVDGPAKYLDGVGGLHDLWVADVEEDRLVGIDCGIDQATLRVGSDSVNTIVLRPTTAESAPFDSRRVRSLKSRIGLTGGTVYRLEFSVWADNECSTSLGLQSGTPANTMVCVNGSDVTNAWSRDQVSINLPKGRSKITVIVVSGTDTWVNITPPSGFMSAIERPIIKDSSMISSGDAAATQTAGKVIVNFDPDGMNILMSFLSPASNAAGTIRTKFILETSDPTTTPTVTDIYVVAGV